MNDANDMIGMTDKIDKAPTEIPKYAPTKTVEVPRGMVCFHTPDGVPMIFPANQVAILVDRPAFSIKEFLVSVVFGSERVVIKETMQEAAYLLKSAFNQEYQVFGVA